MQQFPKIELPNPVAARKQLVVFPASGARVDLATFSPEFTKEGLNLVEEGKTQVVNEALFNIVKTKIQLKKT